jgi:hypothetical protein
VLGALGHALNDDEVPPMRVDLHGVKTLDALIPIGRRDFCPGFFAMRQQRGVVRRQSPPGIPLQALVKH